MTSEAIEHAVCAFGFGLSTTAAAAEAGLPTATLEAALRELLTTHARLSPTTHRKMLAFVAKNLSKSKGATQT